MTKKELGTWKYSTGIAISESEPKSEIIKAAIAALEAAELITEEQRDEIIAKAVAKEL